MKNAKKIFIIIICSFLLTSCSLPGLGGDASKDVVIASGNTSERQILSQLIYHMIKKYTDLNVTIVNNLGSTTLIHTAMTKNSVNISGGMYTGTSLTGELGQEPVKDPRKALELCKKGYSEKFNRVWYDSYGFENTYAFMVREDFAKKHNITKVSQLENLKDKIKVGVDTGWIKRPGDGYSSFKEEYGFEFKNIYPMEIALVYSAINNNEMDVVLGYSTDGRINSYNLKLLEDDKNLFPPYDCCPVATTQVLENHPEIDGLIKVLLGKISSEDMQKLNRMADEDLIDPKNVAKNFLEEHNYFEDEVKR